MRCAANALLFLALAHTAVAAEREKTLPDNWRRWLTEEVVYIISDVEKDVFLNLVNDEERLAFANAFWRKRDTNPSTAENEFKQEHYERLAYANEFLGRDTFRPGWMTDRGRYHILLGRPNTVQNFDHEDSIYPVELWFYNDSRLKQLGLPPYFYLLFFRRHGGGELELYSPAIDGPQELLTGYQTVSMDRTDDVERAYEKLFKIHPELAHASLSFRTDEGDTAEFRAPSFGTIALLDEIARAPFRGIDTSYAERFQAERSLVESDYLFAYVPGDGMTTVFPGPGRSYFLHWVIEIEPQHIGVIKDEDRNLYGSVFVSSIEATPRDDPHTVVLQARKESFLRLTASQAGGGGLASPFSFRGMTPIVPGAYDVRVILRNRACPSREESECIKSYTLLDSQVDVPEWNEEKPGLSDLILAYATERPGGEPLYRPYRFGPLELHPNPRGAYAIGDTLVAAIEPVNAAPGSRVRFRVYQTTDSEAVLLETKLVTDGFRAEPLVAEMSLDGLQGDHYRLVAELVDPTGAVVASRATPFVVSPRTRVDRPLIRGVTALVAPEVPGLVAASLGEQYARLGNRESARRQYEIAVSSNTKLGPAFEALAALELEKGNAARVIELLTPIYKEVPDRYVVVALLGEAHFRQKKYVEAAELLEKAIALKRPEPQILNFLAVSHYHLGQHNRAKELLRRSLDLSPDQKEVRELLAKLDAESSRP